ncbi:MAG: stage III sporulation protein AC [Clostridia bacterium]|nr:stage III sporulation protein AC [Clostridia bacterium]
MSIDIIFKIAGIGILVTIINQLLTRWGREDIALISTVAGLIIVLLMAVDMVSDFFSTIKSAFNLY